MALNCSIIAKKRLIDDGLQWDNKKKRFFFSFEIDFPASLYTLITRTKNNHKIFSGGKVMKLSKTIVGILIAGSTLIFSGCIHNDTPDELPPSGSVPGAINGGSNLDSSVSDANFTSLPGDGFTEGAGIDAENALTAGGANGDWTPITDGPEFPIIYFGFDLDTIDSDEMASIEQVASYMNEYPELGLIVEGHTDDVGTNEYNRALGERRAISIMTAFATYGVGAERISTISYGEDMPAVEGTDAQARAMNRRGVLIPAMME